MLSQACIKPVAHSLFHKANDLSESLHISLVNVLPCARICKYMSNDVSEG
jgi:hypothetical protein